MIGEAIGFFSRRGMLRAAAAVVLVLGAGAGIAAAQQASPADIRYGLQRGALGALKVTLPIVQDEHGLRYDYKIFNDATAVILALEQKELEIGNVTAQHLVRAIDEGMGIVLVAGWGGGYNVLLAGPDIELERDDLAGLKALVDERKAAGNRLKIGVPTGSQQHLKLIYVLTGVGIDPDADVEIVNIPFPNHPRALDGREVDMAMSLAPFAAMAVTGGSGQVFNHVYGGPNGSWEIGYAVRKDLVDEQPELVQRIVDSHVDALRMFVSDVDKQVEYESAESSFPPEVIEMAQRDFIRHSYRMAVEDIERTARQMHELGWTREDRSAEIADHIDFRFLEKATGEPRSQLEQF